MFDELRNSVFGDAGVPFPFPMDVLISLIGNATASVDADGISRRGKEASPACHFDFEGGKGFVIVSGKCADRDTEDGAQRKQKRVHAREHDPIQVSRSARHVEKLCTVESRKGILLLVLVGIQLMRAIDWAQKAHRHLRDDG